MSINTGSPTSRALEPNTLLKIVDVKGADGKAALLQFVVQEIMKPEGDISLNPSHPWSAASKTNAGALPYDVDDVDCRNHGLQVVSRARRSSGSRAKEEVLGLQGQESACLSSVREMAEYFHGSQSGSGDEGHMFRVFAGVREFVAMLDMICREAGEIGGDRVGSKAVSWMAAAPVGMTATP